MKKLLLFAFVCIILASCSSNKSKLVGTWKYVMVENSTNVSDMCDLKFTSDGNMYLVDNNEETLRATWIIFEQGDSTFLTIDNNVSGLKSEPVVTSYLKFEDDVMVLENQKKITKLVSVE